MSHLSGLAPRGADRRRLLQPPCSRAASSARAQAEALTAWADALFAAQREDAVRGAIITYRAALARWQTLGDAARQADVAGSLGDAWDNLGDMPAARAWSAHALALYRRAGDAHGEAMALSWVGIAEVHLDHARDAIAHFEQARDLALRRGDDPAYAYALQNLGYAYNELEDWRDAERAITAALPIFARLGDRNSVATCHNNLGSQRGRLGDIEGALAEHGKALAIRVADDQKLDRGWSYQNLGGIELDLRGDAQAALARFEQARAVWTEVGNQVGVPLATDGIARAEAALGHRVAAIASFDAALAGYQATRSARGLAQTTVERAEVSRERAGFIDGLAQATTAELPSYQARALLGLAQLDVASGDLFGGTAELERGIALLESMRARVIREEHRRSFFALVQTSYELRIQLALAAHDDATAFAASERARARTLLEALANAGGDAATTAAPIDAAAARALLTDGTVVVSYLLGAHASHSFVVTASELRVVELPPRPAIACVSAEVVGVAAPGSTHAGTTARTPNASLGARRMLAVRARCVPGPGRAPGITARAAACTPRAGGGPERASLDDARWRRRGTCPRPRSPAQPIAGGHGGPHGEHAVGSAPAGTASSALQQAHRCFACEPAATSCAVQHSWVRGALRSATLANAP